MKNIRDKIEDIFRNYPDVGVNRNKFLIDELEQLFFQEKQEIVEEICKISEPLINWNGWDLEGKLTKWQKDFDQLKQKLNK